MKLSIGIVGLPNVGKSTLFNLLTRQEVHVANYPFATIDPNVGVVEVPDERLDKLAEVCGSAKTIPAAVEFYDIAGLVEGANRGEGLGNQFLHHIRETHAIVQVVRCFENEGIVHVSQDVNPVRDITTINTELALKDLDTVQKRLEKVKKDARSGSKEIQKVVELLETVFETLQKNQLVSTLPLDIQQHPAVSSLTLLTAKRQIYCLNGSPEEIDSNLLTFLDSIGADYVIIDFKNNPDFSVLIQKAYAVLDLISFFTAEETETRAWTTKKGALAPQAAGEIHSDFESKFIRAEVIEWDVLVETGGWVPARQKGLVRLEGKEYEIKDGDVILVRHG